MLHDILNKGIRQFVGKKKYTIYDKDGRGNRGEYKRLQEEQKAIGWDNLLRGKCLKLWRSLQKRYIDKQKVKQRHEEQRRKDKNNMEQSSTTRKKGNKK